MRIGIECFKDIEIRSIIESQGRIGKCEITGKEKQYIYDTEESEELAPIFSEVLDVYTSNSELPKNFPESLKDKIEIILERDWSIFNIHANEIKRAIMAICKTMYNEDSLIFKEVVGIENMCDSGYFERKCIMKHNDWESFVASIKNKNRFHSNHINLKLLEELFQSEKMQVLLKKGGISLYRARISEEKPLDKQQMGPPPLEYVTAGRANSKGIRCLYLASDVETTFHELRARDLDYISIGTFTVKKDVKLVDLSNLDKISPFSDETFECDWFAINMPILKKISYEIAKPLRRQDSELDYLPTQYIADFVKSLGFDGICYRSTLNPSGVNYAIFEYKKFECERVTLYHVKSLKYNTEPPIRKLDNK